MRKSKFLIFVLSSIILINMFPITVNYAYERKGHDDYLTKVLFKNFLEPGNRSDIKDEIEVLESASYLAIDQFNGNGQKDLDYLNNYGVKGLPTLRQIDYSASGKTHRSYTHRGWDFEYTGDTRERWRIRKQILIKTAEAEFDFHNNEKQKESFCAVVYYAHILGDLMDDESYKIDNGLIMSAGGRIDKQDIVDELLVHFEVLFADQKHTHKYLSLTNALNKYNMELAKLEQSEGGINSDTKFKKRQKYIKKIMDLLPMYLPEMLKEETFFYNVFYKV